MCGDVRELDDLLSAPGPDLAAALGEIDGDIAVLGAGGKMGVTLALMAARAGSAAGPARRVIAVSRFSSGEARAALERGGVETIPCDLLDREALAVLPDAANVIFMAGRKFGTSAGGGPETWAANTAVPALVADRFAGSRTVVFSTGCVYPLVSADTGGCSEDVPPAPVGEYAWSCLGRERVFEAACLRSGSPTCILRLNYAIDLRYGVLHDIASKIARAEPVDLSSPHFNCIWQGDANRHALMALRHCTCPATVLNITGPGTAGTREVAEQLGGLMGKPVTFTGTPGETCYLADATRAHRLFGLPAVTLDRMVEWTAGWVGRDMPSLGKPTHFEVRDGEF